MEKQYISNLEVIPETFQKLRNPQDVNAIVTRRNNKGLYLKVYFADGEELPLTKEKSSLTFPFEPMVHLYNKLGTFYMENFTVCHQNYACFNKNNVKDFSIEPCAIRGFAICATFKNNSRVAISLARTEKGLKKEMDALVKALKNEGPSYIL